MNEFVSPIDGHRHYGDAGRAECAVCCLAAHTERLGATIASMTLERDRLRAVVDAARDYRRVLLRDQVGEDWLKRTNDALEALFAALEQLDVSPSMGDED